MFGLSFPRNTREHTHSYYAASIKYDDQYPTLMGNVETDICVVGGGFTGVNTALELSERGFKVVLVEANRICWGASGRNGGQIIGGVGGGGDRFHKSIGDDGVEELYKMGIECVDIIRDRIDKYSIDCDLRWGYCDVALKPRHMRWLEATFKEEQDNNYPHPLKLLNAAELKEYVGSDVYLGGMYNATGGGHLHPTNLCLGEARAAADHGAVLFEQSRVLQIDYGTSSILHTEQGSVKAQKVILCGNAYMENLVPKLAKRVLPASTCVVATTQLSESLAESILPKNVAVCDPRTALDYFRLTADRRLLFGGLSNYTGLVPSDYKNVMYKKMLKVYPQLEGVEIDYAWDGQMGIGINRMPQLGKLTDNVYFIQAYSGHGVAPTHMMARITAEHIAGESKRFDIMAKIRHWPFPGGRFLRRPGMALGMLYFKALDFL